jgi:hypothetical protein
VGRMSGKVLLALTIALAVAGVVLILFGTITIYKASPTGPLYYYFFPQNYGVIWPAPPIGGSYTDTYALNYAGVAILLAAIPLGLASWKLRKQRRSATAI